MGIRTLGITGGIGSGKSAVCTCLKDLGAVVFEADLEARKLMESSAQMRKEIVRTFGSASYTADGSLNRTWLADQVFGDEDSLAKLNAIVHPGVGDAFDTLKERLQNGLLIHEAALIYEAGLEDRLDAVCVVSAPEDVRIRRVKNRDGLTDQAIRLRMQKQLPSEEKERRADVVLVNAGDRKQLQHKTRRIYELAMSGAVLTPETFRSFRRL